jgi:nitrogenase iron protein NifH
MIKIAIYGKGGIGKSTVTSNLSAALSHRFRVMQIGCDPKADSTTNLVGKRGLPTVLDAIREKGDRLVLEDIVFEGYNGVLCVESGGPTPGIGCAGLGIIAAFKKLEELNAYGVYQPDIVLYDVLGDVVCGGFAMPMRQGYADYVFIVTSGEMMAMFAASNISRAIENFGVRGYAKNAGIILNRRNIENETALVSKLAEEARTRIVMDIRRSGFVQRAEDMQKTVVEAFPDCDIAGDYFVLANKVVQICGLEKEKRAHA